MKNDLMKFILAMVLLLPFTASYAFNVAVLLSNHTKIPIHALGKLTYDDLNGHSYRGVPIEPPIKIVAPKTNNVPQDIIRKNLKVYLLDYFEIFDEEGHFLEPCLSNYLGLDKGAIIHFDFYALGHGEYRCKKSVRYT